MDLCLDSLILTDQELQTAKNQVQELAYRKWQQAGSPEDEAQKFWLEAEREWIEQYYVPHRYPDSEKSE